jgi:hypothetical protein
MEFQTRNEEGDLNFFESLDEAIKQFDKDNSVWKISYQSVDLAKSYRWRPKTPTDVWQEASENKIKEMCAEYTTAGELDLFWINQPMDAYLTELNVNQNLTLEEIENIALIESIKHVVCDKDFRNSVFMSKFL